MKTPPPEKPFDPDDPNVDPWADDPNAPKEPGYYSPDDAEIPWSEDDLIDDEDDDEDSDEFEFPLDDGDNEEPTPTPIPAASPPPGILGPAALFDSQLRGEIEFEILFQQTKAEFRKPRPVAAHADPGRFLYLPIVLALALWGGLLHGAGGFAAVLFAKLFHDLGHLLGQRFFGYRERDLRFVLLPERWLPADGTAPAARRVVVFLLGPLPGLALAFAVQALAVPELEGPLQFFVLILLGLNLADLWVTNASDGGRIFERIPFLRGPWPNVLARAAVVGLLVAAAVWAPGVGLRVLLGSLALLVALGTVRAWRLAKSRRALANVFDDLPERAEELTDDQLRNMLHVVLTLGPESFEPADLARALHNVQEQAARPAMPTPTGLVLFATYLFGWLLVAATVERVAEQVEGHRAATRALLASFDAVSVAEPADRPAAARDCVAAWDRAEPSVRRDADRLLTAWLDAPPEKPESLRAFANRLKGRTAPNE